MINLQQADRKIIMENVILEKRLTVVADHSQAFLFILGPDSTNLVRYLWKPLENFGVPDPVSAAKNYTVKEKTDRRLKKWMVSAKLSIR